jgi:hypothetical protein
MLNHRFAEYIELIAHLDWGGVMKKWMLLFALMLIATDCLAEKYRFEESALNGGAEKRAICVDMMANLKELGEPPMVCDRKFSPKFKQFSLPSWTKLNPWENRELIFQIWEERYRAGYNDHTPYAKDARCSREITKQRLKGDIDRGDITLAVTHVKINDKATTVLQFVQGVVSWPCTASGIPDNRPLWRQHYVVDLTNRKVDFKATKESVLRGLYGSADNGYFKAPADSALSRFQGDANEHYADLFIHQGLPYVAFWYGNSQSGVLLIGRELDENFCIIEYNATDKKRAVK